MSTLGARLNKLERSFPEPLRQGRWFRVVTSERDEAQAQKLLEAEGYDPENGDRAIFHIIVSPACREPWSEPPYILR